jgi:hypothetical protein
MSQLSYDQQASPAALPKAGRRVAGGCIALFMLPFLAAGLSVIAVGVRELRRGGGTQQWLVPIVVGAVFTAFAAGFVAIAFIAMRSASRDVAARAQNPEQPWRWRKEWIDGVIVDRSGPAAAFLFIFSIVWNAIAFLITFVLFTSAFQQQHAVAFVLIFPAIGVFLMVAAVYQLLRRRKFGVSRLMLDHMPITPGSTFRGDVDARVSDSPENGFQVRIMCVHRVTTGGSRSRSTSETIIWADEQTVAAGSAMRSPVGTRVPFTFTIPADARPSDERMPNDEIVWRIGVKAELPGIDYAATFEVPVFATGDAPHAQTRFAVAPAAAATWTPSAESHIAIGPVSEGGEEIRVTTRAKGSEMFGLAVFALVWFGVVGLMFAMGVFFFAVLFALFGCVVVLAIADNYLGRTIIRASRTALLLRRSYPFGLKFERTIDPAEIESITSNLALSSQTAASLYTVDVTIRGGMHYNAARAIRERSDAEMLAVRLLRDIGRGERQTGM